jgi:hypothetical protein
LEEIQTKVLRVFLLPFTATSIPLPFFKRAQPLTVSVKEKGGKPDRKPYPLPYGLRNPHRNLKSDNSQVYTYKTSTTLYVHEFGYWRQRQRRG